MAICPSCQAQIEIGTEYFGALFTCPQCRAVYFIDFNGIPENVQVSAQEPVTYQSEPIAENYVPEIPPLDLEPVASPMEIESVASYEAPAQSINPLQDVIDFANNEGSTSLVSYSLEIKGLDLKENIQLLRDVFTDVKLQINFEEMKTRIKNGKVRLEKLDPSQAAVIAFRLRPLPLEMKWEQNIV